MPDPAVRRQVVASVVGKLETALPFGPSDAPPTVRPSWIERMFERFGFSVPQAAFTSHVASLGGLFTTRHAELWLAGNWTEWCTSWEPGLARRARVRFFWRYADCLLRPQTCLSVVAVLRDRRHASRSFLLVLAVVPASERFRSSFRYDFECFRPGL